MNYALAVLALVGFVIAGSENQKYLREMRAHEILEQYGTRLQHCLNTQELEIVTSSKTLSDGQKNWVYEEDMRTCEEIEAVYNESIKLL